MEKEMNVEEMNFCQSCGMPMHHDKELHGTNADGSENEEYCRYCYVDGVFTVNSMKELVELSVEPTAKALDISLEQARQNMEEFLPTLKRWQK